MRQLKRLDSSPTTIYQKLRRGPLRWCGLTQDQLAELQASTPSLVLEEADSVLCGWPSGGSVDLHYAFPSADAFRRLFSAMFQQLAGACQDQDAPFGYRFRLTERSSRAYVEPILTALAFHLAREWTSMELVSLPGDASSGDRIASGFRLRGVTREDVPSLIDLEERAFPNPQLSPEAISESMKSAAFYRVLEELSTKRLAGSLVGEMRETGAGHIAVLSVHPEFQRRGLGRSMLHWAIGQFRSLGANRATLTTNVDNAPAIALYRQLGFIPSEFGLDYRRPLDEDEVRQILESNRTAHITVNRRWGRR